MSLPAAKSEDESDRTIWQVDENGVPKEDGTYKLEVCYHDTDEHLDSDYPDEVCIAQ